MPNDPRPDLVWMNRNTVGFEMVAVLLEIESLCESYVNAADILMDWCVERIGK